MNRSHIIEILALFRLNRWERLDYLVSQCSAREVAEAIARMSNGEQLEFLRRLDPDQRHHAILALDYPTWTRLIDSAGPMVSRWARPQAQTAPTHVGGVH
ncbi:MAG: hypothetical protein ACXIUM_12575 [Wenzhouxiangella sp.]